MSAETAAALDNALAAHIADEHDGAIVTGWVITCSHLTADDMSNGRTGYHRYVADNQPFHITAGLTQVQNLIEGNVWNEDGED